LALTEKSRLSAYDAEFIALAQALRVKLVTFDRALRGATPSVAIAPESFIRN
jgi:predicted nucleic acid-binding protein